MTQGQRAATRSSVEPGSDDPRAAAAVRRRARDRFILTQPPPPHPTPRRPDRDDDEPRPSLPAGESEIDERCEALLAEIDELIDGR